MTTAEEHFWALVPDISGDNQRPALTDITLNVVGRLVQVRLDQRGMIHVSTMIFFNDGDVSQILHDSIAEFNAAQLFWAAIACWTIRTAARFM